MSNINIPQATGCLAPYIQQEIDHILSHKQRVKQSYQLFKDIGFVKRCQKFMELNETTLSKLIEDHDNSKFSDDEFEYYRQYWYPAPGCRRSKVKLNIGLIHHLNTNGHHWQYYITTDTKYNNGQTILKIPHEHIIEMLCDWFSFSILEDDLFGIFKWYETEKYNMLFHPQTQFLIEKCLRCLYRCINKQIDLYKIKINVVDEKLSPMTYKKLKELGYTDTDWSNWTQEYANSIISKHKNNTTETTTNNTKVITEKLINKINKISENTSNVNIKQALDNYAKDVINEPKISKNIKQLSHITKGTIKGFDNRLKTIDSAVRKITNTKKGLTDAIRYTLTYDNNNFYDKLNTLSTELNKLNYEIVEIKDYFKNPKETGYVGLHYIIKSDTGSMFELQIHTPETYNIKQNLTHKFYEIFRDNNATEEDRLNSINEMINIYDTYYVNKVN